MLLQSISWHIECLFYQTWSLIQIKVINQSTTRERLKHEPLTNESKLFRQKHEAMRISEEFPDRTVWSYYLLASNNSLLNFSSYHSILINIIICPVRHIWWWAFVMKGRFVIRLQLGYSVGSPIGIRTRNWRLAPGRTISSSIQRKVLLSLNLSHEWTDYHHSKVVFLLYLIWSIWSSQLWYKISAFGTRDPARIGGTTHVPISAPIEKQLLVVKDSAPGKFSRARDAI